MILLSTYNIGNIYNINLKHILAVCPLQYKIYIFKVAKKNLYTIIDKFMTFYLTILVL